MEKLIYSQDNSILSDIEHLERMFLKLDHFANLDSKSRIQIREMEQTIKSLKAKLSKKPKATTLKLVELLNKCLTQNPYGDGVVLRVFKTPNAQLEKCSIANFYLNNI